MKLKINPHGIFGIFAIIVMFIIAAGKNWHIPWLYFVLSILLYSFSVIGLNLTMEGSGEEGERAELYRVLLGCHLAFVFLALGMLLHAESAWVWIGVFLAAIAAGLAIPYLLLKKE